MNRESQYLKEGTSVALAALLLAAILAIVGLFAWWAFSWSTHTLVWFIFIFGSVLGSVKVKTGK